jgi:hypothetical protein
MPHPSIRTTALLVLLVLAFACGPRSERPDAEQANFTIGAAPALEPTPAAPIPDPGLLLTIMVNLGDDMSTISNALWRDDLATVAIAARSIADHPHVSDTERQRVQATLGDRFPTFVAGDQRVHHSAVRLADDATAGDMDAILEELSELQSGCVACHEAFREDLREPAPGR